MADRTHPNRDRVEVWNGDRKEQYNLGGSHVANFELANTLRRIFREAKALADINAGGRGTIYDLAHDHAIEMLLVKVARIATGHFVVDNYTDLMGYADLARQAVEEGIDANKG